MSPTPVPTATPAPTPLRPPQLKVTGIKTSGSQSCYDQLEINNDYSPVGTTLDGRWYYKGRSDYRADTGGETCPSTCYGETCDYWVGEGYSCGFLEQDYFSTDWWCDCSGCACEDGLMLYFDQDCSGAGHSSRWIFDATDTVVSTTAESNLDGDETCIIKGSVTDDGMEPPLGTNTWQLYCDEAWKDVDVTITAIYTNVPLIVTGSCVDGIDDFYEPVGTTNDGHTHFQGVSYGVVLYQEADCSAIGVWGAWVFNSPGTDVSATIGDNTCSFLAIIYEDSDEPPIGTNSWQTHCDDTWACEATCYAGAAYEQLTITQTTFFPTEAPTPAPTEPPSVSPAPTDRVFPLMVTGSCEDSEIDDVYERVGTTLDDRRYFRGVNNGRVLYFDKDCDGASSVPDLWIFDAATQLSTTAEYDLDGDGSCTFGGYINDDGTQPPLGTNTWGVYCDGAWTDLDLTIVQMTPSPTNAPTISERPSVSPAPSSPDIQVTTYLQVQLLVGAMEEGHELKMSLATDLNFLGQIEFEGDRSVKIAGDATADRPTLSGGGENRFFYVQSRATLELKNLVLADGHAQDDGEFYDGRAKGGAIIVFEATLVVTDCILRSCDCDAYVRGLSLLIVVHRGVQEGWPPRAWRGGGCGVRRSLAQFVTSARSPAPP